MTYDELVEWAKTQSKTETDVIKWYALSDVQAIRDMTDSEMVEWLIAGAKYDMSYVKEHWEGLDTQSQSDYQQYMTDEWTAK